MDKKLIFVSLLISNYWQSLIWLTLIFSREANLFTSIFLSSAWLLLICGFLNKSKGFYKLNGLISLLVFIFGSTLFLADLDSMDVFLILNSEVILGVFVYLSSCVAAYYLFLDREFSLMYFESYKPKALCQEFYNFSKGLFALVVITGVLYDIWLLR